MDVTRETTTRIRLQGVLDNTTLYDNATRAITDAIRRIAELESCLKTISLLGGNMSDESLTEATGPSDAVSRGIMYTTAREIALEALSKSEASQ